MLLDGKYQLEGLDTALGSAISNAVDSFAWVLLAIFLSVLFLAFLAFIGSLIGDIPLDFDLPECLCGIFRSARASWGDGRGESESAS
jgi:hypothetical protein